MDSGGFGAGLSAWAEVASPIDRIPLSAVMFASMKSNIRPKAGTVKRALSVVGGQNQAAKQLGLRQSSVWKWAHTNRVPASRVLEVEALTGWSRHELRPDIYPREAIVQPAVGQAVTQP